jgi:hypothetical protein
VAHSHVKEKIGGNRRHERNSGKYKQEDKVSDRWVDYDIDDSAAVGASK